jgi:DNA invertase Pin-like site-specific DNA recombinase
MAGCPQRRLPRRPRLRRGRHPVLVTRDIPVLEFPGWLADPALACRQTTVYRHHRPSPARRAAARRQPASEINVGEPPGRLASFDTRVHRYARVSTPDQNPDHPIDALPRAGVAERDIHLDIASGSKASRPQFDLVMQLLRPGDTLKVTRLDRLGRSLLHLVTLGAQLRDRGIGLHVIEQGIDTATAEGRAMFGMLSVLAEYQRELIVANTHDGLAAARARGRRGGRRPKLTTQQAAVAQQLYDAGHHTVAQIADMFGVPRSTVYGHLDKTSIGQRPARETTSHGKPA